MTRVQWYSLAELLEPDLAAAHKVPPEEIQSDAVPPAPTAQTNRPGREETSEEWHAQNKLSLTVYGASVLPPAKAGGHVELYLLLVSEVLDHDAQIANMLLNQVLVLVRDHPRVNWPALRKLWLVSDCGPHFRPYESAAHFLVTLLTTLKVKVHVMYLGEQHGKGACDRLFGWTNEWLQRYLQEKPTHCIKDLVQAYRSGSTATAQMDPSSAAFLVHSFDPGQSRPSRRLFFNCSTLKISRTYSLSAEPNSLAPSGITIRNNVFSDLVSNQSLGPWSIGETIPEDEEQWRRGYYDKPRSWKELGPQAGDVNELTRKYTAQKPFKSHAMPAQKGSLEEKLSAKARTLSKQARKRRRQQAALKADGSGSSSTSSSSTSSSSDSTNYE